MNASGRSFAIWSAAAVCCTFLAVSQPASALVVCNHSDCWQTESKIKWPGETFMFHDDGWWTEHKDDQHFRLHSADPEHDPKRGFWADGEWHTG